MDAILATKPKDGSKKPRFCLLFFDRKDDSRRTWAWMTADMLLLLGEPQRDKEMLLLRDKSKRKNVYEAYKRALASLEEEKA